MNKLTQLHQYLLAQNLFAAEKLDSVADEIVVSPALRPNATPGEIIVCETDYHAVFHIEDFEQKNALRLQAALCTWLIQSDGDNLNPKSFEMTVEVYDTEKCSVEFSIPFNERVLAVPAVNGKFSLDSETYNLVAV